MKHASTLAVLLSAASSLTAQTFSFPDFSNPNGVTLNGSATQSGNALRITNNGASDVGSVFYNTALPVAEGFETTFRVRATSSVEGFALVITNTPTGASSLGGNLWGLGYGFGNSTTPIGSSLAIEIDATAQTSLNDTNSNEVSVHTAGTAGNTENEGASLARVAPGTDFTNNQLHTIRVTYTPGQLQVFLDDLTTPILSTTYTFENGGELLAGGIAGGLDLPGIEAFVGITASNRTTGGNNVELSSWTWESFFGPDDCFDGNVLAATTGPHDVLTIDGSNGGFLRTVRKSIADPFSLELAPPPGEANAPFVLLATLGIANETTALPTIYGQACFPLTSIIDIGSFLAPYQVQVPPGIALPFPFTFQAVMATNSSDPNQLELTNAVGLSFTPGLPPAIESLSLNSATQGSLITISGLAFSPFATVSLNGVGVATQSASEDSITFLMPANVPCDATLTVRNPDGQEADITFNPTPVINSEVNNSGPVSGNTVYVIIGEGFSPGMTATIGGVPTMVQSATATVVVLRTPPGTPGAAPVVLTTPGGCIVTSTFTYL